MANINKLIPFILKWEGGYVNDPNDLGGATNMGVTLKTWQNVGYDKTGDGVIDEEDLKQIFVQDVIDCVLKPHYWDRWQADKIWNQSVANLLVDWLWASGTTAVKTVQKVLNLTSDGIVGEKTLAAINNYPNQLELFDKIKTERIAYIERICQSRPANKRYKKGWLNRLNDIKFTLGIFVCLLIGITGCKSVASAEHRLINTETTVNLEKDSVALTKMQWNHTTSHHSESTENTGTTLERITVRFDTSSFDSIAQQYPVKEISKTIVNHGKMVRSEILEKSGNNRSDSTLTVSREVTGMKEKSLVKQQEIKTTGIYRWLYVALALIFIIAVSIGYIRKKTGSFF
jgi:lysozyme family protein